MKLELREPDYGHGDYEPGVDPPLVPCPFCGFSEADDNGLMCSNTHTAYYAARCTQCGAEGPIGTCPEPPKTLRENHEIAFQEAIEKWNTRSLEIVKFNQLRDLVRTYKFETSSDNLSAFIDRVYTIFIPKEGTKWTDGIVGTLKKSE